MKEAIHKGYMLHDSVQMKYLEQRNLQSQEVDEWLSRVGGGEVEAVVGDGKEYKVFFEIIKLV